MEVPRYLQILWSHKILLTLGLAVAIVCGFVSGYSVSEGKVESKATFTYTASTTMLLGSNDQRIYRSEVPGQSLAEGQTSPVPVDLVTSAGLYAYLISGDKTRRAVEKEIGTFAGADDLTAVRRTTQPRGDEAFPGRTSYPIVEVIGIADTPSRAQDISRTATKAFIASVAAEQKADKVPVAQRVRLSTISTMDAVQRPGSNPAIPVALTFFGVFLAFVALIFALHGAGQGRARRRASKRSRGATHEPRREEALEDEPRFTLDPPAHSAPSDEPIPVSVGAPSALHHRQRSLPHRSTGRERRRRGSSLGDS